MRIFPHFPINDQAVPKFWLFFKGRKLLLLFPGAKSPRSVKSVSQSVIRWAALVGRMDIAGLQRNS